MPFPSDKLAAHLAHLLNKPADADPDAFRPGFIYAELTRTLGRPHMANALLHQPGYAWRMGPEEAAEAYFKVTFERVLRLTGRKDRSVAHLVLIALAQRGREDYWPNAELKREPDVGADNGDDVVTFLPGEFLALSRALELLPQTPEPGSAATKIRERDGPLWLCCQLPNVERKASKSLVPDEISLWNAIDSVVWNPLTKRPRALRELAPGPEFNAFCAALIDALRTANRPVQEVLGLGRGLCPFDWVDDVPINQLRQIRKFLRVLPEGNADTLAAWEDAFQKYPVPSYPTARHFWESPLGVALRRAVDVSTTSEPLGGEEDVEAEFLDEEDLDHALQLVGRSNAISAAELRLLGLLCKGIPISDALERTGLASKIGDDDDALADFVDDLHARIAAARINVPA